ncbi:MAG: aminoglycoside phosphotransferase, partial [Bacteroidetes bacterium]
MTAAAISKLRRSLQQQQGGAVVEIVETHISWVLLGVEYAYKIKKPVRLSFLDFSTLALRRSYCYRELALNRRYAPELYLDVVPVVRHNNHYAIVEDTTHREGVIDYAVKMRRLDQAFLLNRRLDAGD